MFFPAVIAAVEKILNPRNSFIVIPPANGRFCSPTKSDDANSFMLNKSAYPFGCIAIYRPPSSGMLAVPNVSNADNKSAFPTAEFVSCN